MVSTCCQVLGLPGGVKPKLMWILLITVYLSCLGLLHDWTVAETGTPRDGDGGRQRMVVLGMGKLGARELNLSSDIDLIFAYTASGQTDGPRPLSNEQFFVRLAK